MPGKQLVRDDDLEHMMYMLWQTFPAQAHRLIDDAIGRFWAEYFSLNPEEVTKQDV